jgi:ketosteroid isomerase-like protein
MGRSKEPIMNIKLNARLCTVFALLTFSSLPSLGDTMSDSKSIQLTLDKNTAAVASQNMADVPNGDLAKSSPALQKMFEGFFAVKPKLTFSDHNTLIADDVAVHTNNWKMDATLPDGTKIQNGGLSVIVLRKQPDGNWLMVIDNPFGGQSLKAN